MTHEAKENMVKDLINNMASYSNGKANPYRQSGYNFVQKVCSFYISPRFYLGLVKEWDFNGMRFV